MIRLLLFPFVLAELDCLVLARPGVDAQLRLLEEVTDGAYELVKFNRADVARAHQVAVRFRSQPMFRGSFAFRSRDVRSGSYGRLHTAGPPGPGPR